MSEFAANLRALRTKRGMNQDDLAAALGIAKSTVSMYERGQRRPNLDMLSRMAELFGVAADALLGKADEAEDSLSAPNALHPSGYMREQPAADTISGALNRMGSVDTQAAQDAELMEYLEMLRTRPECRMLMSTIKHATKQQIVANVAFIESLRRESND